MTATEVGLLSAVIAATVSLVVAVITHFLSRNREHEKWHLERLYDATRDLEKRYADLDDALFASPAFVAAKSPGAYPHPLLDDEPHAALVRSSRAYQDALTVLKLLLRDFSTSMAIGELQRQLKATTNQLNRAYEEQDTSDIPFCDEDGTHHSNATRLNNQHERLVDTIANRYFAPPKARAWKRLLRQISNRLPWN